MIELITKNWNKRTIYKEINTVKKSLIRYKELREQGYISIALTMDNIIRVELCTEGSRQWAEQRDEKDVVKIGTTFQKEESADQIMNKIARNAKKSQEKMEAIKKEITEKSHKTSQELEMLENIEHEIYFLRILMDKVKHPWYTY